MDRKSKQTIQYNSKALKASEKDLKAIFRIMFHHRDLILCEDNDGFRVRKCTFGQMYDRILHAAAALYAAIGDTHQYVALEMENKPEWVVAFWAILMSGNKPYLVNMRYPQSLTEGILQTMQIKHVVCEEKSDLPCQAISVASLEQPAEYPPVPEDVFENELAFSSSATSMKETVCIYSGDRITAQILNFEQIIKENPRISKHYKGSLKQLAFLPFYHVFGLFAVYFWFSFFGRTIVFLRDYSADTILKTCRRHQVTHIFAVPMLWHSIETQLLRTVHERGEKAEKKLQKGIRLMTTLQNIFPAFGPEIAKWAMREVTDQLFGRSVMFCINGGSYLRDSAMELLNGIGYSMHNGYGMSEIGITSVELRRGPKARNLNSIGHPFSSVEYRLDNEGVLQVRGESLCVKKIVDGVEQAGQEWFSTGDNMRCEKGHYYILGRVGDLVIGENGENINPDMVEKRFVLSGAKALSVLGLGQGSEQELSLVVQLGQYTSAQGIAKLISEAYAINETLPKTMAVRKFYFTRDELAPPTAVKVSRMQLIKKIEDGQVKLTPFAEMTAAAQAEGEDSDLMKQVKQVIASVLGIEADAIGAKMHIFYDLGATSLQYFSIVTALAKHFHITDFSKTEGYRYTPEEICQFLESYL